jgi:hypothetical protein
MLAMMLICISLGLIYNRFKSKAFHFFLLSIPTTLLLINYPVINVFPILDQNTLNSWVNIRQLRGLDGFPSNPFLSLNDQLQVVDFFTKNIHSKDRIFYLQGYLNAEISPLVDKVFYSLNRYLADGETNPQGGNSYLIIGPYQQGIWGNQPESYLQNVKTVFCQTVVFQNPSYLLCTLKPNLLINTPK